MHILFLTENFPPEVNATASRVYERARYWIQWGHRVTVITGFPNFPVGKLFEGYRNHWYRTEIMDGIRVVRVKTFISPNRGVIRRLLDFLSFMVTGYIAGLFQKRPDLVVATSPQFFVAVSGCALAVSRRRPFVFELSDLWPDSVVGVGAMKRNLPLRMVERLELFMYHRARKVVALTRSFKENLVSRGVPEEKIHVVLNGVEMLRYFPRPYDEQLAAELGLSGKFVVAYIGTHGMAHALVNVVHAAERLRDVDDLRFLMVGAGAEREILVREAAKLKLDNIVFVPLQPKERIPAFWSLSDVALVHLKNSPVFANVIPSKIFEAMGMGVPVLLAAPRGEAGQIIEDEEVGLWVPAEDPDALAEAVMRLKNQPDERSEFADRSRKAAIHHTREEQARRMLDVLLMAADKP